jgi:hypothetical protein
MNTILLLLLFIALLVLIDVVFRVIRRDPEKRQAEKRLKELTEKKYEFKDLELVKEAKYSDLTSLNSLLSRFPIFRRLARTLEQADVKRPLGFFILITVVGVGIGLALSRVNLTLGVIELSFGNPCSFQKKKRTS